MFLSITVSDFKGYAHTELAVSRLTVVTGANNSGKSTLVDLFRFLRDIGRGLPLADIAALPAHAPPTAFSVDVVLRVPRSGRRAGQSKAAFRRHLIAVQGAPDEPLRVVREALDSLFESHPEESERAVPAGEPRHLPVRLQGLAGPYDKGPVLTCSAAASALTRRPFCVKGQFPGYPYAVHDSIEEGVQETAAAYRRIRVFDFEPGRIGDAVKVGEPLGEAGAGLAAALQDLHGKSQTREALLSWLRAVSADHFVELAFDASPDSPAVALVNAQGRRQTLSEVGSGTLRMLATACALLTAQPGDVLVFDRVAADVHPTLQPVLAQMLEQLSKLHGCVVLATSIDPNFLASLAPQTQRDALLTLRDPSNSLSTIARVGDLPGIDSVWGTRSLGDLARSGWLDDAGMAWLDVHPTPQERP